MEGVLVCSSLPLYRLLSALNQSNANDNRVGQWYNPQMDRIENSPEAAIGKSIEAIPTPALIVDLQVLDQNLRRMAAYFEGRPCKLRPHFKSHKSIAVVRRQLAAGSAVGITCAKLSEAEVLVAGGIENILIANQVVGENKALRLADLNRVANVRVAVDSATNITQLASAAREVGVTIGVLVEVDIGMGRCGVRPGPPAMQLARAAAGAAGLRLDGLQGYEGHLVMIGDRQRRTAETEQAIGSLLATRRDILRAGLPCPIVSGGSSSTYDVTGAIDGIDEVQAGSYALMDCAYRQLRPEFLCAASVLATVISAGDKQAVADVGLKGMGNDFGPPVVAGHADAVVRYVAEEHTVMDGVTAAVGSRMRMIPSHGCTTCNLHRRMWAVQDDRIVDVWPIEGSGCLE
jgi:D-serine deaminase-like pyridoxal phosphate-dependent protein